MGGRGFSGRAGGAELICGRGALTTLHAVLQARIACTHSPQPTAHVKPRRGSYACATALRVTRAFRYGSGGSYGRPGVPGQPVRNTGRPTSAVAAVAASLKRFGWQQAIVTDPKGVIVVGHTRRLAALKLGWTTAPVVTIPSRQARAYRLVDNRTSELTSWDTDLLPDELAGLNDLDIFSFDDVLPPAATAGKTDPDDIPETPKNPITHKGDLWVLGTHRVLCGDSTNPETVERLLDGAEPDLMVTDPPYGVNYDATWRYKAGVSTKDGAFGKSVNDDTNDWQAAYAIFPGSIAYVWMSSLALPVAARGLDACGFVRRSLIIWDKGHIVIGRGHYHWRHESCWYAVKKGAKANWAGDRKASTLWEIDNPRKSETGHSAQKPVECMQRAIHNHRGDVYDPFVGSGTTVIAGEQEGRRVYAIEIEPAYVDVTVKRWEDFTGRKATRVTTP